MTDQSSLQINASEAGILPNFQRKPLAKWLILIPTLVVLTSCFIPDNFTLNFKIPDPNSVEWNFNGTMQFFAGGRGSQKQFELTPKDIIGITAELKKIPGTSSAVHTNGMNWHQQITWRSAIQNSITFPTVAHGHQRGYWLVSFKRTNPKQVLVETIQANAKETRELQAMGYRSRGTLCIETTGKITQHSGRTLVRSSFGFGSALCGSWGIYDPKIQLTIDWP